MKTKKKIIAFGMGLFVLAGTITGVSAYTYVSGTSYQTVTIKDIPGGGHDRSDFNKGSKKATSGNFATFMKTFGDAWLGNYGELVNSSNLYKSLQVGLPLNSPALAQETGVSVGQVYFLRVASHDLEPSNSCDVTVKFSADNLRK